ncbi:DoxX family protein [Zobellia roscoffensis]|uniref:DoxX family protein n=1 Tax=Zobellia roscoffensis TaxID=2779508 RepID=UPI00188A3904|nr:DoxX family protein [Zobellia roscoffensis]
MKNDIITFWITTGIIFLLFGVVTALTANMDIAKQSITALGYPEYFGTMLNAFKIIGALVLIIPRIPPKVKEWTYAGFGIDFISAFISMWAVEGVCPHLFFPLVMLAILVASYVFYHRTYALVE